jgi:hypothetical protein
MKNSPLTRRQHHADVEHGCTDEGELQDELFVYLC